MISSAGDKLCASCLFWRRFVISSSYLKAGNWCSRAVLCVQQDNHVDLPCACCWFFQFDTQSSLRHQQAWLPASARMVIARGYLRFLHIIDESRNPSKLQKINREIACGPCLKLNPTQSDWCDSLLWRCAQRSYFLFIYTTRLLK